MIDLGGRLNPADRADHVEAGRCGVAGPAQRDGAQVAESRDLALGILHGQHVVVAGFRIDPETGCDHAVRGQGGDHVVHHLALVQSHFAGAHAIHIELQGGVVDILRDENVGDAGNRTDLAGELERQVVRPSHVAARNLNVDRRRHAHVQYRVHQAARLEIGRQLREVLLHLLLDAAHIFVAADLVVLLEADLHERRVHGGVGGVDGGEVGRGADIGDDHAQIFGRNHLPDQVLHLGDFVLRDRQPRAAWRLEVDHELAGIGARKEGESQQGEDQQANRKRNAEGCERGHRPAQNHGHDAVVEAEETLEAVVEPDVEAIAEIAPRPRMVHRYFPFG